MLVERQGQHAPKETRRVIRAAAKQGVRAFRHGDAGDHLGQLCGTADVVAHAPRVVPRFNSGTP
jgi:hypothetical protein